MNAMNAKILLFLGITFCLFSFANGENFSKVIIITPDELYEEAKILGDFYNQIITTEVYKTSEFEDFSEFEINFTGYNDDSLCKWEIIRSFENAGKFNYTLAKKIRKFLSQQNSSYVVLFGNAKGIPPSYYYFDKFYYDPNDWYNSWVPTDLFYAVFDENLTIKHSVGRILVNNEEEAAAMVEKLKNYDKNISNIAMFGGKIFPGDDEYMGEISALHTLQNLNLNYTKFFETDGNFKASKLGYALNNHDIVFHFGHGTGGHACFSDYCISGNLNTNSNAIFVSVACTNGAYDTTIIPRWFHRSFAENLLKNDAIAYVGGSRVNYGSAWIYINNGSVDRYYIGLMNKILEYFMTSNKDTVGKAYVEAYQRMINDGLSRYRLRTIMGLVLLGSPLLNFKKTNVNFISENLTINISRNARKTIFSHYYGIYGTLPVFYINDTINITCSSSLNEDTFIKVIYVDTSRAITDGINLLNFSPNRKGLYLIKCTNRDEKRFYFKVEDNVTYASIIDAMASYYTPDNNNNSLYDSFNVIVALNISKDGIYVISGKINVVGMFVASTSKETYLKEGINNVTLRFDGKAIRNRKNDGYFEVKVEIYKDGDFQDEATKCCSIYYKHTQFEASASSFVNFSDIYEYGVNITLDIIKNGTYIIEGDIYCNKSNVEKIYYEKYLTEGQQNVFVYFNKGLADNCKFNETKFSFKNVNLKFKETNEKHDERCVGYISKFNLKCDKPGDVNKDNNIDIFDAVEILEYLNGKKEKYELNFCGDLNNDGEVDLYDPLNLMTKILIE